VLVVAVCVPVCVLVVVGTAVAVAVIVLVPVIVVVGEGNGSGATRTARKPESDAAVASRVNPAPAMLLPSNAEEYPHNWFAIVPDVVKYTIKVPLSTRPVMPFTPTLPTGFYNTLPVGQVIAVHGPSALAPGAACVNLRRPPFAVVTSPPA